MDGDAGVMRMAVHTEGGRICSEEMGICKKDPDCAERCARTHPGGQGTCIYAPPTTSSQHHPASTSSIHTTCSFINKMQCICKYPCN